MPRKKKVEVEYLDKNGVEIERGDVVIASPKYKLKPIRAVVDSFSRDDKQLYGLFMETGIPKEEWFDLTDCEVVKKRDGSKIEPKAAKSKGKRVSKKKEAEVNPKHLDKYGKEIKIGSKFIYNNMIKGEVIDFDRSDKKVLGEIVGRDGFATRRDWFSISKIEVID